MTRRTLSRRLARSVLLTQAAVLTLVSSVIVMEVDPSPDLHHVWRPRVSKAIVRSVAIEDGQWRLRPTEKLRTELEAQPDLWFAVISRSDARVVIASARAPDPDLIVAEFAHVYDEMPGFVASSGGGRSALGAVWTITLDGADATIVVRGGRRLLEDYVARALLQIFRVGCYAAPTLLAGTLAVRWGARRELRQLAQASRRMEDVTLANPSARLPASDEIPGELHSVVGSVNAALQRLEDGFAQQRQFNADAAHELRTPLAIMQARIETLPRQDEREPLLADVQRLSAMLDQLLAVARMQGGAARPAPFDVGVLAEDLVGRFAPLAVSLGRSLELRSADRAVWALADRWTVESALSNLIQNALHAEPAGGSVHVVVRQGAAIDVVDHGSGVAEDERTAIFEPFRRGRTDWRGAGLGLSIVRQAAIVNDGSVTVSDTPSGGATFTFAVPPASPPTESAWWPQPQAEHRAAGENNFMAALERASHGGAHDPVPSA